MIDIFSPTFHQNPYLHYNTIRNEYPLYIHAPTNMYMVSRYDDVMAIMRSPHVSSDHYKQMVDPFVGGRSLLYMEGKEHSAKRNMLSAPMRGRYLQEKMMPVIQQIANELFDAIPDAGQFDFSNHFAAQYPVNVIAGILGIPRSDYQLFQGWYMHIMACFANIGQDPQTIAAGLQMEQEMTDYLMPVIAARRQNPGDDLISVMCSFEMEGTALSDREIKAFVSGLLAAGAETTDKTLRNMVIHLLRHPEQLALLRNDRSLVNNAIAETIRYTPPMQMMLRQATADIELPHGTIPCGSMINLLLAAANRDERQYHEPEQFNILRPDLDMRNAFVAAANHASFGGGRHFCAGAILAAAELSVALNLLLDRYTQITLHNEPVDAGIFFRGPLEIMLSFHNGKEQPAPPVAAVQMG